MTQPTADRPGSITLRPWAEGDDLRLLETWGDPSDPQQHQDRTLLRPSHDGGSGTGANAGAGDGWVRCLVAEDGGVPVAAGVVSTSRVHPKRLWFYAETAAAERNRGIGSMLLNALRAEADVAAEVTGTVELKTRVAVGHEGKVPPGAEATQRFLSGHGFREVQRSRRIVVGPRVLAPPELEEGGLTLEEAATGSVELTQAVAVFYQAVHDWDPAEMTVGRAQQLLLGPQTGASGAVVLRNRPKSDGGTITAFAISYTPERTDDPTDVLIGWDPELAAPDAQFAAGTLLAMLTAQYPVQVEADDAMTALTPMLDQLLATGHARVLLDSRIWATDRSEDREPVWEATTEGAAGPGAEPQADPAELPDPLAGSGVGSAAGPEETDGEREAAPL
ncbi:MAG: GNAT family N-acetyltransferase [Micrococcus sp.]|nr:GNAT family N-acetyltransferase [Micrococcus sp.]